MLYDNEILEDLQCGGYRLIMGRDSFRFGTDSVLLAHFAAFRSGDRVADFGTGEGILPVLICARTQNVVFDALEFQPEVAHRAMRTMALNGLETRVRVHCMDVRDAKQVFGPAAFDVVIANPPYSRMGEGPLPVSQAEAVARFEVKLTLEQLFVSAFAVLKNGGRFFLVHRPGRFLEIMDLARAHRLQPRFVRFVYPTPLHEATLLLIEFEKNGTAAMRFGKPFIIKDPLGRYTKEAAQIYEKGKVEQR